MEGRKYYTHFPGKIQSLRNNFFEVRIFRKVIYKLKIVYCQNTNPMIKCHGLEGGSNRVNKEKPIELQL
jgi:hypothetical protein